MSIAEDILDKALALDPKAREELGLKLLHSVAPGSDQTEEEQWSEFDRRAEEIIFDGRGGSPWSEVRSRLKAKAKALRDL